MRCSRIDRRQKCDTRRRWEANREMRWDAWHGYVFPVTVDVDEEPASGLIWTFCPACGGPLPLGLGAILARMKMYPAAPDTWEGDNE